MSKVRQTFYTEYTDDHKTWGSPRPAFNVTKFNDDLERQAGCIGSIPRFRLRWAGELDDYIIERGLMLTGYVYFKDGIETFVPVTDINFEFPDDAIPAPYFEDVKVFTPRWVIEEYQEGLLRYEKAWFCETLRQEIEESGLIDLYSTYRAPAQIDIDMAVRLAYLRRTLNEDDIRNGLDEIAKLAAKASADNEQQLKDEISEVVQQGLTDGVSAKPITFDIGKSFDIREHINKKLEKAI